MQWAACSNASHNPLCRKTFCNTQLKLEAISSSYHYYLGEETEPCLAKASFEVTVESNKVPGFLSSMLNNPSSLSASPTACIAHLTALLPFSGDAAGPPCPCLGPKAELKVWLHQSQALTDAHLLLLGTG